MKKCCWRWYAYVKKLVSGKPWYLMSGRMLLSTSDCFPSFCQLRVEGLTGVIQHSCLWFLSRTSSFGAPSFQQSLHFGLQLRRLELQIKVCDKVNLFTPTPNQLDRPMASFDLSRYQLKNTKWWTTCEPAKRTQVAQCMVLVSERSDRYKGPSTEVLFKFGHCRQWFSGCEINLVFC